MFKNKHIVVALLIAPVLSLIAYFGTDIALSEKPHAAKEGESYKLVSKSNCRYTSGLCDMENGDFKVQFRSEKLTETELELSLKSAHSLEGIKLSLVNSEDERGNPVDMVASDSTGKHWRLTLAAPASDQSWLRVVIQSNNTLYYGDTQTKFVVYETLLNKAE